MAAVIIFQKKEALKAESFFLIAENFFFAADYTSKKGKITGNPCE